MGQYLHPMHDYFARYIPVCSCSPPCPNQEFQGSLHWLHFQCSSTCAAVQPCQHALGAEAVPEPPTATALCKHLHAITCDQQAGISCSAPMLNTFWKDVVSPFLLLLFWQIPFFPWSKRLTGIGNNKFCAAWHVMWGLVKCPSPSKSVWLFLLISLEL